MATTREWVVEIYTNDTSYWDDIGEYIRPEPEPRWVWKEVRTLRNPDTEFPPLSLEFAVEWIAAFAIRDYRFNPRRYRLRNIDTDTVIPPEMLGIPLPPSPQ